MNLKQHIERSSQHVDTEGSVSLFSPHIWGSLIGCVSKASSRYHGAIGNHRQTTHLRISILHVKIQSQSCGTLELIPGLDDLSSRLVLCIILFHTNLKSSSGYWINNELAIGYRASFEPEAGGNKGVTRSPSTAFMPLTTISTGILADASKAKQTSPCPQKSLRSGNAITNLVGWNQFKVSLCNMRNSHHCPMSNTVCLPGFPGLLPQCCVIPRQARW